MQGIRALRALLLHLARSHALGCWIYKAAIHMVCSLSALSLLFVPGIL